MYKIILVEDEDEVREGIKRKTDWRACGFDLVGDFGNGRDALESMELLQPDAIITDICMPFMDGLEFAEHVVNRYRDVKIIILTGYEDFEYAKQAIKLKVSDYLLKPINSEEFTRFLSEMRKELDEERQRKEDLSQLRIQLNQSLPLLRERFLERMATSRLKREEIEAKLRYFRLSLPGPAYVAIIADVDEFQRISYENQPTETELLRFAAFNIFHEIFEKESGDIVFRTRDDKIAVICSGAEDEVGLAAQTLASYAKQSIEKYVKLTVSLGIGRPYGDIAQIPTSFQEALSALDYRFLLGIGKMISINDLEYGKSIDQISFDEWERKIVSSVKSGKGAAVSAALDEWLEEMKMSGYSLDKCRGSIQRLIVSLRNAVAETGIDDDEAFGDNPFAQIAAMKTMDAVKEWLDETCRKMISDLTEKRTNVAQSQMILAESYIREHYNDPDFSLNQVCNHVYLSISYFSSLFKQHTGETFIEYLTRYRLEKAKELLAFTQWKTYDIAARVGYSDPQYFSVIFKRNTGMTPKEYRALQKGQP